MGGCLQETVTGVAFLGLLGAVLRASSPGILPGPAESWTPKSSVWRDDVSTYATATTIVFAALWLVELAARRFAKAAQKASHVKWLTRHNRQLIARHVMDTVALAFIGFIGCDMLAKVDFDALPHTAHDRLYVRLDEFEFLCVAMLAFQIKNLMDSLSWSDPPEYVFHHVVCILVAVGALHGHFLHLYGIFFFGVSEVSTSVLSALAFFDEEHGVKELGDIFPTTKFVLGGVFIVMFVAMRCLVWPILAYRLTMDAYVDYGQGGLHSTPIVGGFLFGLAGLTVLQIFWLTEIAKRVKEELAPKTKAA